MWPEDKPRGVLADYFLQDYREGEKASRQMLSSVGYEERYVSELGTRIFFHKTTGISVWCEALDAAQAGRSSRCLRLGFHYTTKAAFSIITNAGNAAIEVFASLCDPTDQTSIIPRGDAMFGDGVYATQRDPHAFGSIEAVLYNNYLKAILLDKRTLDKRRKCAMYCVPILINHEDCTDVGTHCAPGMRGIGLDRNGNDLHEPGLMSSHVIELRSSKPDLYDKIRRLGVQDGHEAWRDVLLIHLKSSAGPERIVNARGRLMDVLLRRVHGQEKKLGKGHLAVAEARLELGIVYEKQGKLQEASGEYHNALGIYRATLGDGHPKNADTLNRISRVEASRRHAANRRT